MDLIVRDPFTFTFTFKDMKYKKSFYVNLSYTSEIC